MRIRLPSSLLVLISLLVLAWPIAQALANPVPIALVDLDYRDTSGEPQDQTAQHEAHLRLFMKTLAEDLEASGHFVVVPIHCDPEPCSIDDTHADTLLSAAQESGAKLMMYGDIHKVSTLIQFVKVQVVDVERDASMMSESISFRGDDERAWLRLEKFLAKQMLDKLVKSDDQG
jgi:hypothetical protein